MAGMFDDLIEQAGGGQAPAAGKGMFDDLIAQAQSKPATPPPNAAPPSNLQPGFLSDDPRDWEAQRAATPPAQPGEQRATFLPLSVDAQGKGHLAVPGAAYEPIAAANRILNRGLVHPSEVTPELGLEGLTAASLGAPAENFPMLSRQGIQRAVAAEAAKVGPALPGPAKTGLEQWVDPATGLLNVNVRPSAREQLIRDATDIGVELPDAATRGRFTQNVAGGIGVLPTGTPIQNRSARAIEQLEGAVRGVSQDMGSGGIESAGEGARDSILNWIKKDLPDQNRQAYQALDTILGKRGAAVEVPLSRTQAVVNDLKNLDQKSATHIGENTANFVDEAINRTGMTYEGIKELRTRVFEKLNGGLEPGVSQKALRRIYDALGDDLRFAVERSGVKGAGKARALAAFENANNAAREGFDQRERLLSVIGSEGKDTAEAITERVLRMANAKGGADISRLTQAKSVMPPQAWDELGSALLSRMGQTKDGFSVARWRTAYNSLSEEGKNLLFGNRREKLDKIFGVGGTIEQLAKWGNPSGSARVGLTAGAIASAFGTGGLAIPSIAAVAAGDYMLARFFARIAKAGGSANTGAPVTDFMSKSPLRRAAAQNAMTLPIRSGDTATNPETGKRLKFDGRQWVPIQ